MLEDDDMRAVFFDPDDFGREVTIKPNGRDEFTIKAIFDARPVSNPVALQKAQVGFKDGMTNTGAAPQLRCRTIDVVDVKAGRALVAVDGKDFSVWDVQPDGTGLSTLILKVA
jgi:hypothetical protein